MWENELEFSLSLSHLYVYMQIIHIHKCVYIYINICLYDILVYKDTHTKIYIYMHTYGGSSFRQLFLEIFQVARCFVVSAVTPGGWAAKERIGVGNATRL